jgi:hypothetical protein
MAAAASSAWKARWLRPEVTYPVHPQGFSVLIELDLVAVVLVILNSSYIQQILRRIMM